jgi:anti-sigma regulatory factor (Ser/Thr protein kinase)
MPLLCDVFEGAATELTSNAICHGPKDGTVTMSLYESEGACCVEVCDCGYGFDLIHAIANGERIVNTIAAGRVLELSMEDAERHKGLYMLSCVGELSQELTPGCGCIMRFEMRGETTE